MNWTPLQKGMNTCKWRRRNGWKLKGVIACFSILINSNLWRISNPIGKHRNEYLALPVDQFDPWVQRQMHGGGWTVFGLYAVGQPISGACALCPNTAKAIQQIPGQSMAGFSRLAPHTHVKPHVGWAANVYRLHLPLVVPSGCPVATNCQMTFGRCCGR